MEWEESVGNIPGAANLCTMASSECHCVDGSVALDSNLRHMSRSVNSRDGIGHAASFKSIAMAAAMLAALVKILMILVFTTWVCVWFITPTGVWRKSWHKAEDGARSTIFGYSAPVLVRTPLGIISGAELLTVLLFLIFLAWTYYSRISNDFKKMIPNKSLQLNTLGSMSEACLALLLLPVLRRVSFFQLIGLPFEASVRYHIWLGNAMMLFSTLHGLMTIFILAIKHKFRSERTGRVNIAGVITLVAGLIIWTTSLPPIRRKQFELFYYTHHLYPIFIVFFLFHGGDRHFYAVLGGVLLFAVDWILRLIQSSQITLLVSARILPCKAIELTLSKHPGTKYNPTSILFIKIPSISSLEWHPFSITSSCSVDKDTISVIVKCYGWWTNQLYDKIHGAIDSGNTPMVHIRVSVEGPYGPPSPFYERYESLVLVGGGIGITPLMSILQDIVAKNANRKRCSMGGLQLIYAVKKVEDLNLASSIWPLLLDQKKTSQQVSIQLKIFVTQEDRSSCADVGDLLQGLPPARTVSFESAHSRSNTTICGPESWLWKAATAAFSCAVFVASLLILNHAFLKPETNSSKKKSPPKNPSWVSDVLIICSLIIAMVCGGLVTVVFKWRKKKSNIDLTSAKKVNDKEIHLPKEKGTIEGAEVHFLKRPDFKGLLSEFTPQKEGYSIGVLVCGPESMQQSVALACRQYSCPSNINNQKKPLFSYHSLSFQL
ncbi:hypothetical protein ACLOJK_008351 [Asimina triloba]